MSEFDAFKTRDRSNEGIKLDLVHPDGSPSDHWMIVRNFRSDAYRKALGKIQNRIAEKGAPDDVQRADDRMDLVASLVAVWSFKTEFTPANVKAFLADAQLVCEQVDRVAMDDERFFGKGSTPSTDGPDKK